MKTSDFVFDLPEELIAQVPSPERSSSRLLVFDRKSGSISHHVFRDISKFIPAGDLLVLNRSKVIPARMFTITNPPAAPSEVFFIQKLDGNTFSAMVRPGKKFKPASIHKFPENKSLFVHEIMPDGLRVLSIENEPDPLSFFRKHGEMPFPPYITSREAPTERYQTVYAGEEGSVAAPTAGLHFDEPLLQQLHNNGVHIGNVVLHVGIGTFKPVECENIKDHKMHHEDYFIPEELADTYRRVTTAKGKVWACGTTSARTLESVVKLEDDVRTLKSVYGSTDIFITPGYKFKAIDHLITNFHLPGSTLIMLVAAFAGLKATLEIYRIAVEMKYRFYSFGDAMLIL
ncbi:MAG: tRNA preQ1(34) S-adenosylmethionine ribosyltransferase-isomerase QueA [Candidatus Riflebacteria bacterium]|nr:tRNA preQ1(34) S-adenosylmethionine ribosyltransferase-isomerase QueA [Candidatus Riflebacteria bacterium]